MEDVPSIDFLENEPYRLMKCQDCGREKPDVHDTTCPFAQDIHGEIVEIRVCDHCLRERANDI